MPLNNIILLTDSYKSSHYLQYPPGIEQVYSYVESRKGEHPQLLFFGLQAFIKRYLLTPITQENIDEAEALLIPHGLPFNRESWEHILKVHSGFLPLRIKALKEGSLSSTSNAVVTIENTDSQCFWLTSYIETLLLSSIWYPSTVATRSYYLRQLLNQYHDLTSDADLSEVDFKLHDFGVRGCSSMETAGIGGLAHLVNFRGSDSLPAIQTGRDYYNEPMAALSIPAAEHATITSWGRTGEVDAYRNMIQTFKKPGKMVAVVSDSYDIYKAVDEIYGQILKGDIINSGGTIVIRPDSGDPTIVPIQVCQKLMAKFGYTKNSKGYKVLPDYLRVIQGDGITRKSLAALLENMAMAKLSLDNFTFGMGGGLTQMVNRDTQGFAMKCSAVKIEGQWRDVFKDPITDPGKKSKKGRLAVVNTNKGIRTIRESALADQTDLLEIVYEDGKLLREQTFAGIRELSLQ